MGYDPEPSFCCFGITDECNFRCKMCFKWQEDLAVEESKFVSADEWKKAIDSVKSMVSFPEKFVINFGGGEALLRPDLLDIVSYAAQNGFITNIASNAWVIDEAMAEKIAKSGLRTINLSLDSIRSEVHDELRGMPGAAEQVKRAVSFLRKYSKDLEIGICSVIYNETVDEIVPLIKWVQKNADINWIVLMAAMQPNNTQVDHQWQKNKYGYLWPKNKIKVFLLLQYIKLLKKLKYKIQNPYCQLDAFARYFCNPEKFVKKAACNMNRAVHVSATGDFFHCFRWDKIGNICEESLENMWQSEKAAQVRESVKGCTDNCHFLLNCFYEIF